MDVISGLGELLPSIVSRREEIEKARRMPRDLVASLQKTGVFSLTVPSVIGGLEAPLVDSMRAIELVAAADGSTGWCTMIGAGNNFVAGYINEVGAKEIFADPTAPTAGLAAPAGAAVRVDGGVRVNGRWSFASGITHCDWAWAGCIVMQDGRPVMTPHGPEIIHVFMPVAELEIHDTWFVSGLCGTGSMDFSVTDLFVPEHRIFSLFDPSGHRPETLYQLPPVATFVSQLASVSLGIARGALDELIELAQTKTPTMSTAVLADKPMGQISLAEAEAALAAARAYLYGAVEDVWNVVAAGGMPTPRQHAMVRLAGANATATGARVTATVNTLAGGSSIYSASSLQRHMRDAEAVTHHFTMSPHVWEDAGRVLLGREPASLMF